MQNIEKDIVFFEDVKSLSAVPDKIYKVIHADEISMDVVGEGSFEIQVLGQVVPGGPFRPKQVLSEADYSISSAITNEGFYRIDITGLNAYKVIVNSLEGHITYCKGKEIEG